jgi:ABC-type nitrate/sulfonate/bicarbonate transport system substrate-binding protein
MRALGAAALVVATPGLAYATETIVTGMLGSANSGGWPFYIGLKKGFFADAGVALDIIYVPTAPGLVQQLAAGSLDLVGTIGVVEPIHAVEKGAPVALLRIVGAVSPYEMMAKPTITGIKDLTGKIVMIGGIVDINRIYLERMMQANGLHDGDYDIVVAGSTGARFAALKSGAVDATMLAAPFGFYAEAQGFRNIGMILDYTKDLPFSGADVSLAYAAKHRDAVIGFRTGLDRAIAWFNDGANRTEAIDILAAIMRTDRGEIAQSYDFLRRIDYFATSDTVSRRSLQSLIDAMKALGDIEGTVTPERLVIPGLTRLSD